MKVMRALELLLLRVELPATGEAPQHVEQEHLGGCGTQQAAYIQLIAEGQGLPVLLGKLSLQLYHLVHDHVFKAPRTLA